MPVPRDNDQVACRDRGDPVGVEDAEWAFGGELVSGVDGVPASGLQCLAETEGALINVEAEVIAVGGHGRRQDWAAVGSAAAPLARRNS